MNETRGVMNWSGLMVVMGSVVGEVVWPTCPRMGMCAVMGRRTVVGSIALATMGTNGAIRGVGRPWGWW